MNIIEMIRSSFVNLLSNKMRSGLTMLGIVISVASVILIHVVGDSLNSTLADTFSDSKNANRCIISIVPSAENRLAPTDKDGNFIIPESNKFTEKLIEKYCSKFDGRVEPVYETSSFDCTVYTEMNKPFISTFNGVNSAYYSLFDNQMISGRFISDDDIEKRANTAVISDITANNCFGSEEPLGQYIYVRDTEGSESRFVVVGVYKYPNTQFMSAEEKSLLVTPVYICYSRYLLDNPEKIMSVDSQAFLLKNTPDTEKFRKESAAFFSEYFNDDRWETEIFFMTDEVSGIQKILRLLTRVMTLITVVSTIVGGIGIMNVMTVSVNERIREIGVKRAIGARSSTIITEFLTEATLISVLSAIIGIIIGLLLAFNFVNIARIFCHYSIKMLDVDVVFSPPFPIMLYALISGALTGIVFGIYPALKASSVNITDSLRNE